MLIIRDLNNKEEALVNFNELKRTRKVNGERTISFTALQQANDIDAFNMLENESEVEFGGDSYVVKGMSKDAIGEEYEKHISKAVKRFFIDLINDQQPNIHNGSMTFANAVSFVLNGTGYAWSIVDSFNAQPFENFGNTNRLALFQAILERYGAEFELNGNQVVFKREIGNKLDGQFRYGYNIEALSIDINTDNLATRIRGKGANIGTEDNPNYITVEYISPNESKLLRPGQKPIYAEPLEDERYTTAATLREACEQALIDYPVFTVTLDHAVLQEQGFETYSEGDYLHLIYEPLNDLELYVRVMEITETFNSDLEVVSRSVVLGNYSESLAQTYFDMLKKELSAIVDENGLIKYSVLDMAVKLATEALLSAQTELNFDNGIIAVSKDNPNHLVLFNSAGIGISTDGGQTFNTAMTAQGLVASVITGGQINANNVSIGNNKILLNNDSLQVFINGVLGASLNEGKLTFNDQSNGQKIGQFAATVWSDGVTKGISMNMEANRFISLGHYIDALTGYTPMMLLNPSTNMAGNAQGIHMNLPIRMNRDVWMGTNALRLGENNTHNHSALWHGDDDSLIVAGYTGVRLAYLTTGGVINDRLTVDSNSVDAWQDLDMHGWKLLRVGELQQSSSVQLKTNITDLEDSGLDIINNLSVKKYHLQQDIDEGNYSNEQVGLISEMSPSVSNQNQTAINLYKLVSYNVKAIQELSEKVEAQDSIIQAQNDVIATLVTEIEEIKQTLASINQ